jgi:hypothetical protein
MAITAFTPSIELEKGSMIADVSRDAISTTSTASDLTFKSVNSLSDNVECKNDAFTQMVLSQTAEIIVPNHEKELSFCRILGAHFG